MLSAKARTPRNFLGEPLKENRGNRQQHERDSDLAGDEQITAPKAAAFGKIGICCFQGRNKIRASGSKGRSEPKQHRAGERNEEREIKDAMIQLCGKDNRQVSGYPDLIKELNCAICDNHV